MASEEPKKTTEDEKPKSNLQNFWQTVKEHPVVTRIVGFFFVLVTVTTLLANIVGIFGMPLPQLLRSWFSSPAQSSTFPPLATATVPFISSTYPPTSTTVLGGPTPTPYPTQPGNPPGGSNPSPTSTPPPKATSTPTGKTPTPPVGPSTTGHIFLQVGQYYNFENETLSLLDGNIHWYTDHIVGLTMFSVQQNEPTGESRIGNLGQTDYNSITCFQIANAVIFQQGYFDQKIFVPGYVFLVELHYDISSERRVGKAVVLSRDGNNTLELNWTLYRPGC